MSKFHLLIDKFIDHSISKEEREALEQWIQESESNMAFFKSRLKESNRKISAGFDTESAYQRFLETLTSKKKTSTPFHSILRYAALLILLFTIGFLVKRQLIDQNQTSTKVVESQKEIDVGNNIVIKLADGTTKVLSSEGDEEVTDAKGNIVASKGGNSIVFDQDVSGQDNSVVYHEVFIPFGQTFQLRLSDGTKVWLNAGSKLRFPQSFVNSDRKRIVYLEGEAFFDVVTNKDKPFVVNTQEIDVEVLGTQFNISSYETDDFIATTLVEGVVKVYETRTPENGIQLSPNFQANYDKFGNHFSKAEVDTDVHTAWMQGRLIIDNLRFSEILIRLERRYFVKFVNRAESLNDEIYKGEFVDEDIESVLKTIALSTPFNYEINQNIITITQ
ncbi:FecR family protein [Allomuricauda sp. SCSIO 65647]|uniref:FecR family protein n=1 Tax=Allomuricauda sp. SCSIO 65647 TaxID=2908843 RepID=UPI001F210E15|nr:FecR family protein [Muricauda sp. SCSIO 65647]UJH68561.1 FecR domain-containing protein [Muricauda sp. SCSIO 65647]